MNTLSLFKPLFWLHRKLIHQPRVSQVAEAMISHIGQAKSLLDVGAGTGEMAEIVGKEIGAQRIEGVDVKIRDGAKIPIQSYNGERLPFADKEFEVVLISDVLHHCTEPRVVLAECLRVASRCVVVKDHLAFGRWSRLVLTAMDKVGNAEANVPVIGRYFSFEQWAEVVAAVGAKMTKFSWPLDVHALPFRLVTKSEYQFVATIERAV